MMTGKISDAEKISKTGCKLNSNMVKISSSKSILSYQNGSALNVDNRECNFEDGMPGEGYAEESSASEDPFAGSQNLKSECLDLLRKKLISDWSLSVFSCDLENKLTKMEPIEISKERQSVIQKLVVQISQLSDAEKLLLYLKLPSSTSSPFDPLRQPLNPLGNRQEIQQTIVWIKTHLEEDSEISIPKQDVYDQYLKYCENVSMKPLSTADFGKVMKQVYPGVRPRRLGTRGNSRYCYSGMRNTYKLPTPILPKNSTPDDCGNDGTSFFSADGNKLKKTDKSKRKLTSSSSSSSCCRNDKFAERSSFPDSDKSSPFRPKTSKSSQKEEEEEEEEEGEKEEEEEEKDEGKVGSGNPKEEVFRNGDDRLSDNSFGAFGLRSDFGPCSRKTENERQDSSEGKRDGFINGEETEMNGSEGAKRRKLDASEEPKNPSKKRSDRTTRSNLFDGRIANAANGFDGVKTERRKTGKATKAKKSAKVYKKSYVPIQPKPADAFAAIAAVRFGKNPRSRENGIETEAICEESDSQEPEEEIVRYFKHLDESDSSKANGRTAPTAKRNPIAAVVSKGSEGGVPNRRNEQILRSRSCFEKGEETFGANGEITRVPPRSQSSVGLATENERRTSRETAETDDGRNAKVSHLRILLENSLLTHRTVSNPYSRTSPTVSSRANAAIANSRNDSGSGRISSDDSNFSVSDGKNVAADKNVAVDPARSNGLKTVGESSFASPCPNARTKNFNFTPISSSTLPQLPPNPFVGPGNFRQDPDGRDHFLSPSVQRKLPRSLPPANGSGRVVGYDFPEVLTGNSNVQTFRSRGEGFAQGSRPRSYSSTNFYRTKTKRNPPKHGGNDRATSNPFPRNQVRSIGDVNLTPFSSRQTDRGFVSAESLSSEVQKFLESNSKMADGESATIRSRSVPLRRMMAETGWMPNQNANVYGNYFDLGNNSGESGKLHAADSAENSEDRATAANFAGQMTSLGTNSLPGEIFTGDPSMAEYFSGDFERSNGGTFPEAQTFAEESGFANKLDLNSNGTFAGAFATDSGGIGDAIKSYLPDFGGLDGKVLVEPSGSDPAAGQPGSGDRKLFESSLYETGNDNLKDPVITSFKPVLMAEMTESPASPVLNFFASKINEDSQQLIEFFDFED